jgi:hypothetical protein
MINPYCKSLSGLFGQLVFYGILKEEDAQCLKTDFVIKPTFFLLFVAAIVLHLLNTFVMNAMSQYVRDMEENARHADIVNDGKFNNIHNSTLSEGNPDNAAIIAAIEPVDALFTDKFRWLLVSESRSRRIPSESDSNSSSDDSNFDMNNEIFMDSVIVDDSSPNRSNHCSNRHNHSDDIQSMVSLDDSSGSHLDRVTSSIEKLQEEFITDTKPKSRSDYFY